MKAAEVRKLSDEELAVEIDRLQRRVFDLRRAVVTEKIEDPSLSPKLRRDIARLKTGRRSRELASQTEKANA